MIKILMFNIPFENSLSLFILTDTSRTGDKFETMSQNTGYTKYMQLKIRSVGPADFGSYRCVAKNSLGETDGLIKLDGNNTFLGGNFELEIG